MTYIVTASCLWAYVFRPDDIDADIMSALVRNRANARLLAPDGVIVDFVANMVARKLSARRIGDALDLLSASPVAELHGAPPYMKEAARLARHHRGLEVRDAIFWAMANANNGADVLTTRLDIKQEFAKNHGLPMKLVRDV